jgi:hypothetical protein
VTNMDKFSAGRNKAGKSQRKHRPIQGCNTNEPSEHELTVLTGLIQERPLGYDPLIDYFTP